MAGFDRISNTLKILLLALLLAVQALGHAHAVEHEFEGDNGNCSICSVAGHGAAIVDTGEADNDVPLQRATPACRTHAVPLAENLRPSARAPPLS